MSLNRRELLRWGAVGAGAAVFSSAAGCVGLPSMIYNTPSAPADPIAPAADAQLPLAPEGIDAQLFLRAKAAMEEQRIWYRDRIGIIDFSRPSSETRFHLVDLHAGKVESHLVAHGRGSDPEHSGFLERFSNTPGSNATSKGAYTTADYYEGKYGTSMRVRGLDETNDNAMSRAIVIHNAWYAEPDMIAKHGMLGRSEGCFAMPKKSQWDVMEKLAGGRMIYAEKIA